MFTSVDKAISAVLMGIASIIAMRMPSVTAWLNADTIALVTTILTPLLVYIVPNKTPPSA